MTLLRSGVPRAAQIVVLLVAASMPREAANAAPRPGEREARYVEIVRSYRAGDRQRAVQDVIGWDSDVLARIGAEVVKPRAAGSADDIDLALIREAFPAAVMLHTEAGLYLNWRNDPAAASSQWDTAETLAELAPSSPAQALFLRHWYHAFGLFFLGSYNLDQSIAILGRGRQRFPDDVPIALALGQAYEARGAFGVGKVRTRTGFANVVARDLSAAKAIYRDILAREPTVAEARLRVGNVLEMSGRPDTALTELRQAATTTTDGRLRYLSRLFAGNLLRHASRLPEAEQELSLALAAWPAGQAAALSLAEALHARGEHVGAAATLLPAIAVDAVTPGPDPYRSYYFGDRAEQRRLLEAVAEMTRQ